MNNPLGEAEIALEVLFDRPEFPGVPPRSACAHLLKQLLATVRDGYAGSAAVMNALYRLSGRNGFARFFTAELFEAFAALRIFPGELTSPERSEDADYLLDKALKLAEALESLFAGLPAAEEMRVLPGARKMFSGLPHNEEEFTQQLLAGDPFARGQVFSYRKGEFIPVRPDSVKEIGKFFGFPGVRAAYADHFSAFSSGKTNLPLLINSLPGYGKTSMVLSYALSAPGVVVILPEPEALEAGWRDLIALLAERGDHRFVLFFDDIDPRKVDWYSFRTNVGGAFAPPDNVMPVLAANYEFPPSILSRGRKISYPVFDELRCTEMVEDFLRDFGMHRPPANLVSLIGADYTSEFGQKRFTELSPRTLIRYLKIYNTDPRKRRTMIELAAGQLIQKPDAELFYEFNIELMRSLYGEEYIQRLLKQRLREL